MPCLSLLPPLWLSSLAEESLLKVKCLKLPCLLSPKGFFSGETASKDVNLNKVLVFGGGFLCCFFLSCCEVHASPLGIELGNSCFYADYERVVSW